MKSIWKYELPIATGRQPVQMPFNAEILCVQAQNGRLCLWALVETLSTEEIRHFEVFGTGFDIPDGKRTYIGTVQMGPFVWHVFQNED